MKKQLKGLTVTFVNPKTQKAQTMLHKYEYTRKGSSIYTAYAKPSSKKVIAFEIILDEMSIVGGYGMKITGAGSDIFSCAYKLNVNEKVYLIYHTPVNRFAILMED